MAEVSKLSEQIAKYFGDKIVRHDIHRGQLTLEVPYQNIHAICKALRDEEIFHFELLMDLCGVDYLTYGIDEWEKESTTLTGFSRGVIPFSEQATWFRSQHRFASVYHLLSIKHNHRVRLKTFVPDDPPIIDSVIDIWASANWFEREAFDLYGILFKGHPDLRRLLTDYGFVGNPFRKDFPLIGNVEMRYDAGEERCIYDPVSIRPRTLVPKVIRDDNRYVIDEAEREGVVNG